MSAEDRQQKLEELLRRTQDWEPAAKAKAMALFRQQNSAERQLWYCTNRLCDGKAHEGFPYRHARADQWPPAGMDWFLWLMMSGRGSGKTRSGAGWVRNITKYVGRIAGIGQTTAAFRDVMIEGESGLIAACELANESYDWKPALKEFRFQNGALLKGYTAEEPDTLRGPQHGAGWLDEPAHMPQIADVWSNLMLGLRIPGLPGGAKVLCTTTPLPGAWLKEQIKMGPPRTVLVRVSTMANIDNLDPTFRKNVIDPLLGTREGRQELEGELLEDVEGALWKSAYLRRAPEDFDWRACERIVVAIDPAGTANRKSDETGICVVGKIGDRIYVLADHSGRYSPDKWAKTAMKAYDDYEADAIIVETNFGADMVKNNLRQNEFEGNVIESRAMRGKQLRAEPIVTVYEQGRAFHIPGKGITEKRNDRDPKDTCLEDEMLTWVPGEGTSPNRVDALVWAATELLGVGGKAAFASPAAPQSVTADGSGFYPPGHPLYGRNLA